MRRGSGARCEFEASFGDVPGWAAPADGERLRQDGQIIEPKPFLAKDAVLFAAVLSSGGCGARGE
jgi:hypothetical protein